MINHNLYSSINIIRIRMRIGYNKVINNLINNKVMDMNKNNKIHYNKRNNKVY